MDAASDPTVSRIVLQTCSQIGKSEILLNILGYFIHQDPSPILLVQPDLGLAESFSKDRVANMIRDTPALRGLVADPKSRDSGNTILHKTFPGGHLTLTGANSPRALAMRPIRIVLGDELDGWPSSAGSEGDPVSLARKRTATFWNALEVWVSSPTIEGISRIAKLYEASDRRQFWLPCRHCAQFQVLEWSRVKWEENRPETAFYVCAGCGCELDDDDLTGALERGEWRASADFTGTAGFHLNELYSPWRRMAQTVEDFLEAKADPELLKVWVNTALGELWNEGGESVDSDALLDRREVYPAEVPPGPVILTAGVDIQEDRFELEVVGWASSEESWGIDYRVIYVDPEGPDFAPRLDEALGVTYTRADGAEMAIEATAVDSSFATQSVYDFCQPRGAQNVYAVKGDEGETRPLFQLSRKRPGKGRRAVNLWVLGVDSIKGRIYSRLKIQEPEGPYMHFPERPEYGREYFAQLTAETRIVKKRMGKLYRRWVKRRARNEALDCRVMAYAALKILNPRWKSFDARYKEPEELGEQKKPAVRRRRRRRGSWATNWQR